MKKVAFAFALLLAALALAACGGGDDTTSGSETATETTAEEKGSTEAEGGTAGGGSTVAIEADPSGSLAYTTDEATAKAGKVTIDFTNSSPIGHDVDVEDSGGETVAETEIITESSESTTAELEAGEYKFYCSVPGHRQAGMEGTLTVE